MKNFSFRLLIVGFCLLLTACGFTPLYGTGPAGTGVQEDLSVVRIGNIPDQEGQYLRNLLIDRFYTHGRPSDPAYYLEVSPIIERKTDLDITKSSDTTRAQLRLTTSIQLMRAGTTEKLLERKLVAITSYNILGSEFATRVSETDARESAMEDLARQIELQLSLYFRRQ